MRQIIQESLVNQKDGTEVPLFRWGFIPRVRKIGDIIVFNYPKRGFHLHFYTNEKRRVGVVRTNEKTGKHVPIKIRWGDIYSKVIKKKNLL